MFSRLDSIYVDESKARGYHVAATSVPPGEISRSNRSLRALLKPGQRRIHFSAESDSRRRVILARMSELNVGVSIWSTQGKPNKESRDLCLGRLITEACRARVRDLILERDESVMQSDKRLIAQILREENTDFTYRHAQPHEEPLLWVSDAVVWCFVKGGDWTRRSEALLANIIKED